MEWTVARVAVLLGYRDEKVGEILGRVNSKHIRQLDNALEVAQQPEKMWYILKLSTSQLEMF